MGLSLSKYIELRENGAIAQRGRSLISTIAMCKMCLEVAFERCNIVADRKECGR